MMFIIVSADDTEAEAKVVPKVVPSGKKWSPTASEEVKSKQQAAHINPHISTHTISLGRRVLCSGSCCALAAQASLCAYNEYQ